MVFRVMAPNTDKQSSFFFNICFVIMYRSFGFYLPSSALSKTMVKKSQSSKQSNKWNSYACVIHVEHLTDLGYQKNTREYIREKKQ